MVAMTFRASRSTRVNSMIVFAGLALIPWVALGVAWGVPGAGVGAVIAIGVAAVGNERTRQMRIELGDDAAVVANLYRTYTVPWGEVGRVERRWKFYGLTSPRGEMLYLVPGNQADWPSLCVHASLHPRKANRTEIYARLVGLSGRYGFAIASDLGPGPFWKPVASA